MQIFLFFTLRPVVLLNSTMSLIILKCNILIFFNKIIQSKYIGLLVYRVSIVFALLRYASTLRKKVPELLSL